MSLLEYTLLALLFLVATFAYLQNKAVRVIAKNETLERREHTRAYTNLAKLYLDVVARELANELMQRAPYFFVDHYRELNAEWSKLKKDKKLVKATFDQLALKYPHFEDFDVVKAWDYVFIGNALEGSSNEELWLVYREVKLYSASMCELNEVSLESPVIGDFDQCREFLSETENSQILSELIAAEETYVALKLNGVDILDDGKISTPLYDFYDLQHFSEIRLGIHLKKTNQYGIIGKFYGGDDADYKTYYLSNSTFEKDESFSNTFFEDFMSSRKRLKSIQRL